MLMLMVLGFSVERSLACHAILRSGLVMQTPSFVTLGAESAAKRWIKRAFCARPVCSVAPSLLFSRPKLFFFQLRLWWRGNPGTGTQQGCQAVRRRSFGAKISRHRERVRKNESPEPLVPPPPQFQVVFVVFLFVCSAKPVQPFQPAQLPSHRTRLSRSIAREDWVVLVVR